MAADFSNLTEERIRTLFPETVLDAADDLLDDDAVSDLVAGPVEMSGVVVAGQKPFNVLVTARNNRFVVSCSCGTPGGRACVHVAALLLEWALQNEFPADEAATAAAGAAARPAPAQPPPGRLSFPIPTLPPAPPPDSASPVLGPEADYRRLLSDLTVADMRAIAARRGVRLSGTRRDTILNALAAGLRAPENIQAAVQALSPEARLALQLAVLAGQARVGLSNPADVHSRLLKEALSARKLRRTGEECLSELHSAGLLFRSQIQLKLPVAVAANLPPVAGVLAEYAGAPGRVELASPMAYTRLAVRLLLLAQAGGLEYLPVRIGPDGWPAQPGATASAGQVFSTVPAAPALLSRGTLDKLTAATEQPGDRVDYLARVLASGKLWGPAERDTALAVSTPALTAFLQLDPPTQSRHLFQLALALPDQAELDMARSHDEFTVRRSLYYGATAHHAYLRALVDARATCFKVLALAPAGIWLEVDSLLRTVHPLVGALFSAGYGSEAVSLIRGNKASRAADFSEWRQTYGLIFQAMLAGPAHWLGMCDLGWQRDRPEAFRLTEFGAYVLGQRTDPPAPPGCGRAAGAQPGAAAGGTSDRRAARLRKTPPEAGAPCRSPAGLPADPGRRIAGI
ncbi:MAG: hypothetical protein HY784_03015 [Chloroflexi bacterium]|nr:hypothetical protein [Chloroflexota bacterium]